MKASPLLFFALLGFTVATQATPIIYTFTAIGSGTLGASSFSNATFTITSTAGKGSDPSIDNYIRSFPKD